MRYLLISECLQNDFVAPISVGAPLPNDLHIGRAESRRLLGDPEEAWTEEGPLARFLRAFLTGAQLRYSAHTLTFVESDERQKRFALASTCRLADRLASGFSGLTVSC